MFFILCDIFPKHTDSLSLSHTQLQLTFLLRIMENLVSVSFEISSAALCIVDWFRYFCAVCTTSFCETNNPFFRKSLSVKGLDDLTPVGFSEPTSVACSEEK